MVNTTDMSFCCHRVYFLVAPISMVLHFPSRFLMIIFYTVQQVIFFINIKLFLPCFFLGGEGRWVLIAQAGFKCTACYLYLLYLKLNMPSHQLTFKLKTYHIFFKKVIFGTHASSWIKVLMC